MTMALKRVDADGRVGDGWDILWTPLRTDQQIVQIFLQYAFFFSPFFFSTQFAETNKKEVEEVISRQLAALHHLEKQKTGGNLEQKSKGVSNLQPGKVGGQNYGEKTGCVMKS